jgi:hypothetical protein
MALLNFPIPEQNFEKIRDQIALILADEFANQLALIGDPELNPTIYTERSVALDHTNFPAVNVQMGEALYPSTYIDKQDTDVQFYIDIYTKAPTTASKRGDEQSNDKCARIAGMVRAILMNPGYVRLGFAPPSIMHREVSRIMTPQYREKEINNMKILRIIVTVKTIEDVELLTAVNVQESHTTVIIDDTGNGYQYTYPEV